MDIYIKKGLITEDEYRKALAYQKTSRLSFQEALLKLGFIKEDKVVNYCNRILGF
jgi:hypothetical protein